MLLGIPGPSASPKELMGDRDSQVPPQTYICPHPEPGSLSLKQISQEFWNYHYNMFPDPKAPWLQNTFFGLRQDEGVSKLFFQRWQGSFNSSGLLQVSPPQSYQSEVAHSNGHQEICIPQTDVGCDPHPGQASTSPDATKELDLTHTCGDVSLISSGGLELACYSLRKEGWSGSGGTPWRSIWGQPKWVLGKARSSCGWHLSP